MNEELKKKLEAAIARCAEKATDPNCAATNALQYTQAALNAAHTLSTLDNTARNMFPFASPPQTRFE